jgi:hypothetical protein
MSCSVGVSDIGLQSLELWAVTLDWCHAGQTERTEICIKRIDGVAKVVCMEGRGDEFGRDFLQLVWD